MIPSTEWWSTFFSGLAIELWARCENPEATHREGDFLVKALRLVPGARVLDVPCGNGRLALDLAARGLRVAGVDIAPENIASARERAKERGVEAVFETRDMRDLPWHGELDGAFCFGNSFAYLTDDGNAEFLRAVGRALKPGGLFALETGVVAESILPNLEKRAWYAIGDIYFLAERRHDAHRSRLDVDYTFIQGATVEMRPASYRIYTCLEILRLFEAAGFEVQGTHGSLEGDAYQLGSRVLYVTAVKR